MIKSIVATSVLGMLMFSGCSSDTPESIKMEYAELITKCASGQLTREECVDEGKDLGERAKSIGMSSRDLGM